MGIWPIPRETTYKIIFMDFSGISAIFQKQLKTRLSNRWWTRENMWKENRIVRSQKKNGQFQIGLVSMG